MDRTVAELNIVQFKKLLESETDPAKRQTVERLLAEKQPSWHAAWPSWPIRRSNPSFLTTTGASASGLPRCAHGSNP
jgi:hypothetical protein